MAKSNLFYNISYMTWTNIFLSEFIMIANK